jgi:hypothetical protein
MALIAGLLVCTSGVLLSLGGIQLTTSEIATKVEADQKSTEAWAYDVDIGAYVVAVNEDIEDALNLPAVEEAETYIGAAQVLFTVGDKNGLVEKAKIEVTKRPNKRPFMAIAVEQRKAQKAIWTTMANQRAPANLLSNNHHNVVDSVGLSGGNAKLQV